MGYQGKSALVTLFSETDLQGKIIFANEAFSEISKYSNQELIGRPHSIIRHPDMPKKLFEIIWSTICMGKTFRGVIKNRTKDESHYWVQSTIMPILGQQDCIIRYAAVTHLIAEEVAQQRFSEQCDILKLTC